MPKDQRSNLADFDNYQDIKAAESLDEIEGQQVVVNDVDFKEGMYGLTMLISVTLKDNSTMLCRTGSQVLYPILKSAKEAGAFPADAIFVKNGRAWTVQAPQAK